MSGDEEAPRLVTVGTVNLAVVGCGHGELDQIYSTIAEVERV